METIRAGLPKGTPIELWWQDEARVGQKNKIARRWARRGTRPRAPHDQRRRWAPVASGLALAASLALFIAAPLRSPDLANELVAGHVRSLLVDHLTDVRTSDQHVVKPWFTGKLEFSPPVVDLARGGFPLVGGRLDYLFGHVVAALVYQHREHVINVFIWPRSIPGLQQASRSEDTFREGYHVLHWTEGGMNVWVVSDLNLPELQEFRKQFQMQARS